MSENKELAIFNLDAPISTKDTIESIKDKILSGEIDEAKAGVILKRMTKISEEVLKDKDVKKAIEEECMRHINNQKSAEYFGAKFSQAAVHTYYKFEECNDPLWDALDLAEKQIKAAKKDRETFLKTLIPTKDTIQQTKLGFGVKNTSKQEIIESIPVVEWKEDGEIATIKPPIKGQKMGIKYMKI